MSSQRTVGVSACKLGEVTFSLLLLPFGQSLQRIDEAEPANERLLGTPFRAKPSPDRLAIEVQFELYAEHAILVGAGVIIHVPTLSSPRPHGRRGAPRYRSLICAGARRECQLLTVGVWSAKTRASFPRPEMSSLR